MTGRTPPEWIGKTADTPVPQRVRLRVYLRAMGRCQGCTRKLAADDEWEADHATALVNEGENRERNLQLLCGWCHKAKTAEDVAEKARTYRKRSKHVGADAGKKSKFRTARNGDRKQKMDGTVVDRATGRPIGRER